MLLHASYNSAIGVVILRPADELVGGAYVTISLALTGTLWLVAAGLIVATRGRLGLPHSSPRRITRPRARTYAPAPGAETVT
jgi:hypothetical protein